MRSLLSFTLLLTLGCRDHDHTGEELRDPLSGAILYMGRLVDPTL